MGSLGLRSPSKQRLKSEEPCNKSVDDVAWAIPRVRKFAVKIFLNELILNLAAS